MTAWMRLTGENPRQLVHIRDEAFGYADLSDGFLRLIVIDGDFEADFFHIADALLAEGGVFLDAGANHGLLSFGLAHRHQQTTAFHLFEPNPTLIESIEATRAHYPEMRCHINAVAVSDTADGVPFLIQHDQTGVSRIDLGASQRVPSITLDRYLADNAIEHVALLKMDIEGFELPALRGAHESLAAHRIAAAYFEYFEKQLIRVGPPSDLLAYLTSLDYEVCLCRRHDLDAAGGPTHTIRSGTPGAGLGLAPVAGLQIPAMTDLLAVPRECLTRLGR